MSNRDYSTIAAGSELLLAFILAVLSCGCSGPQQDSRASMNVAEALAAGNGEGYEKAEKVRKFEFPDDHGSHPGFKTEWWYFTGNVKTIDGREFGYQFTLFRYAINNNSAPGTGTFTVATDSAPDSTSNWVTSQIYMAHAALSDINAARFYYDEQFGRGVLGMAGATVKPFKVWLNNWSASGRDNPCQDCFAVELAVEAKDFRLQLQLNNTRPVSLHGRQGLSAKSPVPGNASYYYSYTRLQTNGLIVLTDNTSYPVTGDSWFDHEWSSSALAPGQQGWDWFSLQLSGRNEIMLYRLRNGNNPDRDYYYGSFVHAGGALQTLHGEDIKIQNQGSWRSPVTGISYPSAWDIELPGLRLAVSPKMPDQEVNNSVRYWEGAVTVTGTGKIGNVTGQGYVELTGY